MNAIQESEPHDFALATLTYESYVVQRLIRRYDDPLDTIVDGVLVNFGTKPAHGYFFTLAEAQALATALEATQHRDFELSGTVTVARSSAHRGAFFEHPIIVRATTDAVWMGGTLAMKNNYVLIVAKIINDLARMKFNLRGEPT